MPFCASCGNENPATNSFCSSCGTPVSGANFTAGAGVSRAKPRKSPETMALASTILGVVGGGLFALGWLLWTTGYFSGYHPSDASWILWLLGGICWIVGSALPWNQVKNFLGAAGQVIGFVSIFLLTLAALIGLLTYNAIPQILEGVGFAGLTTASGIYFIPKVRARISRWRNDTSFVQPVLKGFNLAVLR